MNKFISAIPEQQEAVITCAGLGKAFPDGKGQQLTVLHPIDFVLQPGEQLAIVGASGSGKSTFLHLLAGLDTPTSGTIWHDGKNLASLSEAEKSALRNKLMGFVYQFHHLLPDLSAIENVMMPLLIRRVHPDRAHDHAASLLKAVGLSARLDHRPSMLSGGERQRVALARALVTEPKCLLADEPTGNLDSANARDMLALMLELNKTHRTALLLVTHDMQLAHKLDRCVRLTEGHLLPVS